MNIILLWLLLGSLGLNLMWIEQVMEKYPKREGFGYVRGMFYGLLFGVISFFIGAYRVIKAKL